MKSAHFIYHRPGSVEEAISILANVADDKGQGLTGCQSHMCICVAQLHSIRWCQLGHGAFATKPVATGYTSTSLSKTSLKRIAILPLDYFRYSLRCIRFNEEPQNLKIKPKGCYFIPRMVQLIFLGRARRLSGGWS